MKEKVLTSGVRIKYHEQEQTEPIEPPETFEEKIARLEETQEILLMMMLEKEGVI